MVIAGHTVAHVGVDKPTGTDDVIDGEAVSALEDGAPGLGLGQTLDVALSEGTHRGGIDADGEPAVVLDLRNEVIEDRVDAVREDTTVRVLVEVTRRFNEGGVVRLARHRAHLVGGVRRRDVDAVGRVSGDAVRGVLLNLDAVLREVGGVAGTAAEVTGAVVFIRHGGIVARQGVHTAAEVAVKGVTDAITVAVDQALAITVVLGLGIGAASIALGGCCIIVARGGIGTTEAARELTGAIVDARGSVIVAGAGIRAARAARVFTASVVEGGVSIEVARTEVDAAEGLLLVADTVGVAVIDAVAVAVEERSGRIGAGTVVVGGGSIIVAGRGIGTTEAAHIVTGTVILGSGCVIIARCGVRTAVAACEVTGTIIERGEGIVVAGRDVGATAHLNLVAQAVGVGVGEAVSHAVHIVHAEDVLRVEAGHRDGGVRIVVAGQFLRTTGTGGELTVVLSVAEVAGEGQFATDELDHRGSTTVGTSVGKEVSHTRLVVVGGGVTTAAVEVAGAVVLDRGRRVIVASECDHAAGARHELTRHVIHIGVDVEVAGQGVGAAFELTASVAEVSRSIVVGCRRVETATEETGSVVDGRGGVVVDCSGVHTATAREELTGSVVQGRRGVVVASQAVRATGAGRQVTGTVIKVGTRGKVARQRIGTSGEQAGAIVEVGRSVIVGGRRIGATSVEAGSVVEQGSVVVVGGTRIGTAVTIERAAAVILRRSAVVVTGIGEVAALDLIEVADAVEVGVADAGAVALVTVIGIPAASVIIGGLLGVVAGRIVHATGHLILVTDTVTIAVVQAVAVAVEMGRTVEVLGIEAVFVVGVGRGGIVVAGVLELAAALRLSPAEGLELHVRAIALGENLDVQLAAEDTVRGELAEQDTEVITRSAIGSTIQDEPTATVLTGQVDVAAGLEGADPGLTLHEGDLALSCCSICSAVQANGNPAVVGEGRESVDHGLVDAMGVRGTEHVLMERSAGAHETGVVRITRHGAHEVGSILEGDVDLIGRHAVDAVLDRVDVEVVGAGRREDAVAGAVVAAAIIGRGDVAVVAGEGVRAAEHL